MTAAGLPVQWIDIEASLRRLGRTVAATPSDLVPGVLRRLAAGHPTARSRRSLPLYFGGNLDLLRRRAIGPRPAP
jgi:hypothetical protein